MTDTFPRQYARTRRFTLGVPRSFQVSPDGTRVVFLRSGGGDDPVTCLWVHEVDTGAERLIADPARMDGEGELDQLEKARRERSRESAAGIVGFSTDQQCRRAAFRLDGRVFVADLTGSADAAAGARSTELATRTPATDPRLSPSGRFVAYVWHGALRVIDIDTGEDRALADPAGAPGISFGLAEFVAAEEMQRTRGYWWAPDSSALLVARVDENPVGRWYIADPANPGKPANEVRYPAAGTGNAEVSLFLVALDGRLTPVGWDRSALPYLVTAYWDGPAPEAPPLIVVQTRDQHRMQIRAVDTETGSTSLVRDEVSDGWLEIIPGVPARTSDGRIVWTTDELDTRRLVVAPAGQLADRTAQAVSPVGLQVRQILGVDGDAVLFAASGAEPTETSLWTYDGQDLRAAADDGEPRVQSGSRAGGTTVVITRSLRRDHPSFRVLRDGGPDTMIGSHPEQPLLPEPQPDLFSAGDQQIRTALLLPSWHEPGSAALPVLMCPYGGPHGQMVVASRSAYHNPQWFAEQGFAVVIADGRGTPGRGLAWEHAVAGDMATLVLADQVTALQAAAERNGDLDLSRVGIRGWSFGGYLSALAVLRRPDVFHAAVAGAPVTDWRLYDTHYTERMLGHPDQDPAAYQRSSLLADAPNLRRPLLIIHGMIDDNVVVAHSLRLSAALLAAGRQHAVLPLSGVTHMTAREEDVAENLLLLQADFLREALTDPAPD